MTWPDLSQRVVQWWELTVAKQSMWQNHWSDGIPRFESVCCAMVGISGIKQSMWQNHWSGRMTRTVAAGRCMFSILHRPSPRAMHCSASFLPLTTHVDLAEVGFMVTVFSVASLYRIACIAERNFYCLPPLSISLAFGDCFQGGIITGTRWHALLRGISTAYHPSP